MATLKTGDRVRWKMTSPDIMTFKKDQRAEVTGVVDHKHGPITFFRVLDEPGGHTYAVEGEIDDRLYELI